MTSGTAERAPFSYEFPAANITVQSVHWHKATLDVLRLFSVTTGMTVQLHSICRRRPLVLGSFDLLKSNLLLGKCE